MRRLVFCALICLLCPLAAVARNGADDSRKHNPEHDLNDDLGNHQHDSDGKIIARGTIQLLSSSAVQVADKSFAITANTKFLGTHDVAAILADFRVGQFVKVEGVSDGALGFVAEEVEAESDSGDDSIRSSSGSSSGLQRIRRSETFKARCELPDVKVIKNSVQKAVQSTIAANGTAATIVTKVKYIRRDPPVLLSALVAASDLSVSVNGTVVSLVGTYDAQSCTGDAIVKTVVTLNDGSSTTSDSTVAVMGKYRAHH